MNRTKTLRDPITGWTGRLPGAPASGIVEETGRTDTVPLIRQESLP